MSVPIPLRDDFDAPAVRLAAKASKDAAQTRRLLALAMIDDGGTRTDAARVGGVGLRSVRDRVLAFNAEGPAGLIEGKAPGQPPKLNDAQRQALVRLVGSGPTPAIHGVVRWRLRDLAWWVFEEFRISLDETTVGRDLRRLGTRKLSARPQHRAQDEGAADDFGKVCPRDWRRSGRGSRPRAPHDQRTKSAYLFGAIGPAKGKGAGLVMPWCDTAAMTAHLQELSLTVDPGCHAVVLLDQAGWHGSAKLNIPSNITLLPLPPRSPELNPSEPVEGGRTSGSSCATTGCRTGCSPPTPVWPTTVATRGASSSQPWRIMSLGLREWAHEC